MHTTRKASTCAILGLVVASTFLIPVSGSIDHIQCTDNTSLIDELNIILTEYHFTTPYKIGEFDCMESSYAVQTLLQERGYDAYVMYRLVSIESDEGSHAWCVVKENDTYAVIETTLWAFGVNRIGGVVIPEDVAAYKMNAGHITKEPKKFVRDAMGDLAKRLDKNVMESVARIQVSPP
jgi:hypothetical protein